MQARYADVQPPFPTAAVTQTVVGLGVRKRRREAKEPLVARPSINAQIACLQAAVIGRAALGQALEELEISPAPDRPLRRHGCALRLVVRSIEGDLERADPQQLIES